MRNKNQNLIDQKLQGLNDDGIDRRGFLKCMAWAGTGLVWTMSGGIPMSRAFAKGHDQMAAKGGDFTFVQIATVTSALTNQPIQMLPPRCRRRSIRSTPCLTRRISSFTPVI